MRITLGRSNSHEHKHFPEACDCLQCFVHVRLSLVESRRDDLVPERIDLAASVVHDATEVGVDLARGEDGAVSSGEVGDAQLLHQLEDVLKVGVLAAAADDRVLVDRSQPLQVLEHAHAAVAAEGVAHQHDAIGVLHCEHTRTSHDRLAGVRDRLVDGGGSRLRHERGGGEAAGGVQTRHQRMMVAVSRRHHARDKHRRKARSHGAMRRGRHESAAVHVERGERWDDGRPHRNLEEPIGGGGTDQTTDTTRDSTATHTTLVAFSLSCVPSLTCVVCVSRMCVVVVVSLDGRRRGEADSVAAEPRRAAPPIRALGRARRPAQSSPAAAAAVVPPRRHHQRDTSTAGERERGDECKPNHACGSFALGPSCWLQCTPAAVVRFQPPPSHRSPSPSGAVCLSLLVPFS